MITGRHHCAVVRRRHGFASATATWRTAGWMVGMVAGSEVDVRLKAQRRESRTSRGEGESEGCRRAGISRAPHRPTGGRTVRFRTGSAAGIPPPSVLQEPGPAPGCGRRWSVACIAPLHVVADRGTPKRRPAMSGRQSARAATVSERPNARSAGVGSDHLSSPESKAGGPGDQHAHQFCLTGNAGLDEDLL